MTRKEINEIKSQFNIEDCGILRLCGCYVDGEKNKVTTFNETFLNLPEEERHKYLDILKKCLSGILSGLLQLSDRLRIYHRRRFAL